GHGGGHHRDADRGVAAGRRPVDPGDLGAGVDGLPGRSGVHHLAADQLLVPFHQRRRHPRPAGRPAGPGRVAGGVLGRGGGPLPPPGHQRMTLYSRIMGPWKELATPRRVDLLIAAGLLVWGLPDVPWWWEYPGHAGSTPDVLGSLALTLAMSVPFCWRRGGPGAGRGPAARGGGAGAGARAGGRVAGGVVGAARALAPAVRRGAGGRLRLGRLRHPPPPL